MVRVSFTSRNCRWSSLTNLATFIIVASNDLFEVSLYTEKHSKLHDASNREILRRIQEGMGEELKAQAGSSAHTPINPNTKAGQLELNLPKKLEIIQYMFQAMLRVEKDEKMLRNHERTLRNLQEVLDSMHSYGPVTVSKLRCYSFGSSASGMHNRGADLDVCIDGNIVQAPRNSWEGQKRKKLSAVVRFSKQKFLHCLADELEQRGVASETEKIIHARIPVFKYVDRETGVACDIVVGGEDARIKSSMLSVLATLDWRYPALVRIIKIWANHNKLVDASNGMLNSYSLKLLVLFHLQTRPLPVMPPICKLCHDPTSKIEKKRLLEDKNASPKSCEKFVRRMVEGAARHLEEKVSVEASQQQNRETLAELFVSFLSLLHQLVQAPLRSGPFGSVPPSPDHELVLDTWHGVFADETPKSMDKVYHLFVADPLDKSDNASRSLSLAGCEAIEGACKEFLAVLDCQVGSTLEDLLGLTLSKAFGQDLVAECAKNHAVLVGNHVYEVR